MKAASRSAVSTACIVLLAGASGSGKSFLARRSGLPVVELDHFYRDGDDPQVARTAAGTVDWESPSSWDAGAAVTALAGLARHGLAELPVYDLTQDRRVGTRTVSTNGAPAIIAEGIFAAHLVDACIREGLPTEALVLSRPRTVTAVRRLVRDVMEARKPVRILLRRGWLLYRQEPVVRAAQEALGCRPVPGRRLIAILAGYVRAAEQRTGRYRPPGGSLQNRSVEPVADAERAVTVSATAGSLT